MRIETIAQKLGRDFAAIARRRSLCEEDADDFGGVVAAEYERARDAVSAHEAERIGRRRFGPKRVLLRWARMHGFRVRVIGAVGRLQPERWSDTMAVNVSVGYNAEADEWFVTFARESNVGNPKHILGVGLATRAEAVRFAGALLAVLS